MTPEERLARLLDEDRWAGPGFAARRGGTKHIEPRHPLRTVLIAVGAGLAVGALVTVGVGSVHHLDVSGAFESPPAAVSATSAPVSPTAGPLAITVQNGVDPIVGKQVVDAASVNGLPLAYWTRDRTSLTIVTSQAMCSPQMAGQVIVTGARTLSVEYSDGRSPVTPGCLGGVRVTSTYFQLPAGIAPTGAVSIDVIAHGTHHTVRILDPGELADVPTCTVAQLSARVTSSGGAMGSLYQDLVLTNASDSPCALSGLPTISFLRGDAVIGSIAKNNNASTESTVRLDANGGTANARLQLAEAGNYPARCAAVVASGIRVSVPGVTGSLSAVWQADVCTGAGIHQLSTSELTAKRSTTNPGWQDGKP